MCGCRDRINLKKTKVIASGSKGEILKSKVDQWAKHGKRVLEIWCCAQNMINK